MEQITFSKLKISFNLHKLLIFILLKLTERLPMVAIKSFYIIEFILE